MKKELDIKKISGNPNNTTKFGKIFSGEIAIDDEIGSPHIIRE
jgi:hypothetical protein